jgi:ABC-2 type transport system ATP-binding protein
MKALEIKGLTKSYGNFTLNDVSFNLETGFIMGFIGPNGAGKTTTIKSILNLIKPEKGEIYILGKKFIDNEIELKQLVGYTIGNSSFYQRSKVKTITNIIKSFYSFWDNNVYEDYIRKFSIDENKKITELSEGMKIKYQLAIAMSHGAKLLILDEPTSGLDPVARDGLLEIFQHLVMNGEVSILFSTHITSDLEKCADYITFINQGKLIKSEDKDTFIDSYKIIQGSLPIPDKYKTNMISFKITPYGFTGLIETNKLPLDWSLIDKDMEISKPNLEQIMIYHSKGEVTNV